MKLFVHIPKNAGMAIRHGLSERIIVAVRDHHISTAYSNSLLRTMTAAGEHHGYEHARWRDFRVDLRHDYGAFAIVRNPWSRTVSRYTFACLAAKNGKHTVPANYTFEKFLEERHEYGGRKYYWHRAIRGWFPQRDYVTDADGRLQCDVLRFEHFDADVMRYWKLQQPLRRRNVSNVQALDYRDFYTPKTRAIVADWYAADVEFFGFTFDGTATKNIWCNSV